MMFLSMAKILVISQIVANAATIGVMGYWDLAK
jgi:hypothetical protein